MNNIKKYVLKSFVWLISFFGVFSVNSACAILYGQEKEPESLSRYKKIK